MHKLVEFSYPQLHFVLCPRYSPVHSCHTSSMLTSRALQLHSARSLPTSRECSTVCTEVYSRAKTAIPPPAPPVTKGRQSFNRGSSAMTYPCSEGNYLHINPTMAQQAGRTRTKGTKGEETGQSRRILPNCLSTPAKASLGRWWFRSLVLLFFQQDIVFCHSFLPSRIEKSIPSWQECLGFAFHQCL